MKKLDSKESTAIRESSRDSTESCSQGALRCRKAPQGAIGQDAYLQGDVEALVSWEQHLCPGSLRSEHLEGLTEKVGNLGLRAAKRYPFGAAKKRTRNAKMAEALAGNSAGAQPRLLQGGQKQGLQEHSLYGTQGKEGKVKSETRQSGPVFLEGRERTQGPSKLQRTSGGNSWGLAVKEAQDYRAPELC